MSRAQGLPINMIVLTALALLVLVVVGAFFISGMGSSAAATQTVNVTQAQCQSDCQELTAQAFNYDSCGYYGTHTEASGWSVATGTSATGAGFGATTGARNYALRCASDFGACTVTLRDGSVCRICEYDRTATNGAERPSTC